MPITSDAVIYILDLVGIAACAVAATLLAKNKGMDITGSILVSLVGAVGGGTLRDVLLDRHPIFWMTDASYIILIIVTSLVVQIFIHSRASIDKPLAFFDAIGLAAFTLIGLSVALKLGAPAWVAVLMAVITAVAGGLLRDIICNEIPLVLRREIYITASLAGALFYFVMQWLLDVLTSHGSELPSALKGNLSDFATIVLVFAVRMMALRFDWHLPNISLKR